MHRNSVIAFFVIGLTIAYLTNPIIWRVDPSGCADWVMAQKFLYLVGIHRHAPVILLSPWDWSTPVYSHGSHRNPAHTAACNTFARLARSTYALTRHKTSPSALAYLTSTHSWVRLISSRLSSLTISHSSPSPEATRWPLITFPPYSLIYPFSHSM